METVVKLKKRILEVALRDGMGHIPSSLSILDIIWVLYNSSITENDQFILSKGHGCMALYAVLEEKGLLDWSVKLWGHPKRGGAILASTGSLGHGLPMALGLALAKKIKGEPGRVFCLIGDGECNEGTIWESALIAAHHKLDNLTVIVDQNHSSDRALDTGDLYKKFQAFNWFTMELSGHSHEHLETAFKYSKYETPVMIIANTVKGNGVPFMENNFEWHNRKLTEDEYEKAIKIHSKIEVKPKVGQTDLELAHLGELTDRTYYIPGSCIEVGAWFGGSAVQIFNHMNPEKELYVCDTFNGLEDVGVRDPKKWEGDSALWFKDPELAGAFNYVQNIFKDEKNVEVIKGYFPLCVGDRFNDTKFSFVHLDADTFNSTLNCLEYFYPKMSKGGIIVLHDYIHKDVPVKEVCDMFFADKPEEVQVALDDLGVFRVETSQGYIVKQ